MAHQLLRPTLMIASGSRALPVVSTLIAAPCDVPWDTMSGDLRTRHCASCNRDVHNLSAMTAAEVDAFMEALAPSPVDGHVPCISVFQRTDGTILTADCPVGLSARRRRSLLITTLSIGSVALLAMSGLATLWLNHREAAAAAEEPASFVEPPPPPPVFVPARPLATYPPPPVIVQPPPPDMGGVRMAGAPVFRPPPTTKVKPQKKKIAAADADADTKKALEILQAAQLDTTANGL